MDPLRSAHTPQPPTQPSTFLSSTSTVAPSSTLNSTVSSQHSNPFSSHPANPTAQPFAAPLPVSTSACAAQSTMSHTQPLAQALSGPSNAASSIQLAPQGHTSESVPRSEVPPATQPAMAADVFPQEGHGLGGPTATAPFLQDFSLVAEAAKRAQMSIVMRDLESVTL